MPRRQFLGCAAGAVAMGLWRLGPSSVSADACLTCTLLDLQQHGGLVESLSGYESALTSAGVPWMRAGARSVSPCLSLSRRAVLILPGAVAIPPPVVQAILSSLHSGASVILESGAGFAAGRDFAAHQVVLREQLQLRVEAPVPLWSAPIRSRGIPYVDYTWPSPARIRDFSRVVPLARPGDGGDIIARVHGLPVALKRQSGRGTLIFLGSPLGPALWAGDAEARRWLCDVLTRTEALPMGC